MELETAWKDNKHQHHDMDRLNHLSAMDIVLKLNSTGLLYKTHEKYLESLVGNQFSVCFSRLLWSSMSSGNVQLSCVLDHLLWKNCSLFVTLSRYYKPSERERWGQSLLLVELAEQQKDMSANCCCEGLAASQPCAVTGA